MSKSQGKVREFKKNKNNEAQQTKMAVFRVDSVLQNAVSGVWPVIQINTISAQKSQCKMCCKSEQHTLEGISWNKHSHIVFIFWADLFIACILCTAHCWNLHPTLNFTLVILLLSKRNGQGKMNWVREKSGKSQGILISDFCGNPVTEHCQSLAEWSTECIKSAAKN